MNKNEYSTFLSSEDIKNKNVIIAKNSEKLTTILIKTDDSIYSSSTFTTDYLHLKTCSQISINNETVGLFHIIICLSNDINIEEEFSNIFNELIVIKNKKMSSKEVLELFTSIDTIFRTTSDKDNIELQIGLYGELLALKYVSYLGFNNIIDNWHSDFSLKHDIEINSKTRIEIKTTTKEERIHMFKHNQLTRNDVEVYVISVMLEKTENGLSLFDLIQFIINNTTNIEKIILLETMKKRCGISVLNKGLMFNEQLAFEKIKLFDSKKIPQITQIIPDSITRISYYVDLMNTENLNFNDLFNKFCN